MFNSVKDKLLSIRKQGIELDSPKGELLQVLFNKQSLKINITKQEQELLSTISAPQQSLNTFNTNPKQQGNN